MHMVLQILAHLVHLQTTVDQGACLPIDALRIALNGGGTIVRVNLIYIIILAYQMRKGWIFWIGRLQLIHVLLTFLWHVAQIDFRRPAARVYVLKKKGKKKHLAIVFIIQAFIMYLRNC